MKNAYILDGEERRLLFAILAERLKKAQDDIRNEVAVTEDDLYECRRVIGLCIRLGVRFRKRGRSVKRCLNVSLSSLTKLAKTLETERRTGT